MTRCNFAHDDGAYVLGALAPAERAAYERHLAGCPTCREAVAEIAVLPGLLGRLDPAGLDMITDPPAAQTRLPALLAAARAARRRDRRRQRVRYAGAALVAVCLAVVVGLGGAGLTGGGSPPAKPPPTRLVAMQPVRGEVSLSAEVGLAATPWGTEVTMRCRYPATGEYLHTYTFRLVAYGPDGAREQVGSWLAEPGDDLTVTGATRFSGAELSRLEVIRQDGTALLGYDVP